MINVGVIGVGNCFSGLVQGIQHYKDNPNEKRGLMHEDIAGYKPWDLNFSCAFDIGENKVGKNLKEAIYNDPNMVNWIPKDKLDNGFEKITVGESPILDGVGI